MNLNDIIKALGKAFAPLWAAFAIGGLVIFPYNPLLSIVVLVVGWYMLYKAVDD